MIIHPGFVGCDVSKHHLDIFDARSGQSERRLNTPEAAAALARDAAERGDLVVFEATGAYDRGLRQALAAAGAAHVRVNPGRARDFARAAGFLAKTDKVDARMLAAFGQALNPAADAAPDRDRERLGEMLKRRDQLVKTRAQERVRKSECADGDIRADIEAHLVWLDTRIKNFDLRIGALAKTNAAIAKQIAHLKSAPGVGPVTATVLVALMPELGARSPKTIAALAGLAPLNADSGQKRGQRRIRGGRRRVREALYMAALSAARSQTRLGAFYRRLRQAGKSAKQAIIAVARKLLVALNAMVRDNAAYAA
jgi:transposase